MYCKVLGLFFMFAVLAQAQNHVTVELDPVTINHFTDNHLDILGGSISIPQSIFDSLLSCHVVFPNGVTYEAYPNSNLPENGVEHMVSAFPFCGIAFRGSEHFVPGTYQLLSVTQSFDGVTVTLTKQKYHLVVESS